MTMRQSASATRLDRLEGGAEPSAAEQKQTLISGSGAGKIDRSKQPTFRGGNFCPTGNGQLTHYTLVGPHDGRLVVCIHGMTLASYTFTDISHHLVQNGFRVLRYDLFGRGLSSGPPSGAPCNSKTYVSQLELLLQALGLWAEASHEGVLIGASLGGAIATAFCAAHKDQFRQLILIAPVGLPHFKLPVFAKILDLPFIGRPLSWALRVCCKRPLASYVVDMFNGTRWHEAIDEDVHHDNNNFVAIYMRTLKRFEWQTMKYAAFQKLGENTERGVACIWGEEDAVVPSKNTAHIREVIPHCSINVIPHAGHEITVGDCAHDPAIATALHDYLLDYCQQSNEMQTPLSSPQTGASSLDRSGSNGSFSTRGSRSDTEDDLGHHGGSSRDAPPSF